MIKNTGPQEFKDFTSEYTEEYKEANYKTLVRDFAILENKKLTRKVKVALIFSHGTAMVPFFTLNQYIGMTDERISNSVGERNEVLQNLLDDYINTPLKETSSNASKVYNNLTRDKKQFVVETNKFLYFYQQLAIEELIKYEKYLLEELGKVVPEKQGEKSNSIHQPHDPNLWNKEAYELFKYLYDYYYLDGRSTNVKLASIWHYFNDYKHLDRIKEPKYILHATKDQYTEFIKSYEIKLTNMDKRNSYYNTHKSTIDGHLENYEKGLLELQNT